MGFSKEGSPCLISHPTAASLNVGHAQTRPAEEGGDTEVDLGEGDTEVGLGEGALIPGSPESRLLPLPCCNRGTEREVTPTGSYRSQVSWLPGTLRVSRILFGYLRFSQGSSERQGRGVKSPVTQSHLHH